ncbi:MAG: S8 family serine peptidase [Candidatus Thalassarchaeaceae archaeon]|nr:S8 family serine peptidase [Candidatus Thalassarchaeaceae archaeon]
MNRRVVAIFAVFLLTAPLTGSLAQGDPDLDKSENLQISLFGQSSNVPYQQPISWNESTLWWEVTSMDSDRNGIHDSLQSETGIVNLGISYSRDVTDLDIQKLSKLGINVNLELPIVNALLIGGIDSNQIEFISQLDGVVMVERYGSVVFYGDIQTPAVKARNSSDYPVGAWNLGVSGQGMNIALVDTGVDNEHPGLSDKFVAGYDAVCYVHTDPTCLLSNPLREDDGSFDPDDGNQHGTACMGMASATGIEADGSQSNFYGSAPNATLVDIRIGTDVGAGPFENYLLEQEFYESAMNGLQWVIEHHDDAWPGVSEEYYGIDIISLSWGITSHESGGSDGSDMHSRILDEAMEAGIIVSVAAGNDGPDNDGLSGMGSSDLSVTVGATDDQNTVNREDDTVAGYSSRGPRKDNGDGNPLNELKPEISAPGSNIIQAEGCVTSGSCSNLIDDASSNTYTSRGSGTSYATPSVSGVMALVWEANENLTTMQLKEVLKQTSERRGEPSAPDVDPYWNRDFGYGMIDAYSATKLAMYLKENGITELIDPSIQNHLLSRNDNNTIQLTGHSWSQSGSVESVQFRIDGGSWYDANFNSSITEVSALTPFEWYINIDSNKLSEGNHTLEVTAFSSTGQSLPVTAQIEGEGDESSSYSIPSFVYILVAVVALVWLSVLILLRYQSDSQISSLINRFRLPNNDDIIDAEIVD